MDRLTKRGLYGIWIRPDLDFEVGSDFDKVQVVLSALSAYEDTGLKPEEIEELKAIKWWSQCGTDDMLPTIWGIPIKRLRQLAKADRDGECVVLPCKVGDTVYEIARGLSIYKSGLHSYVNEHVATELNVFDWARQGDFGKTVFLTRAEAEAALRKEKT